MDPLKELTKAKWLKLKFHKQNAFVWASVWAEDQSSYEES